MSKRKLRPSNKDTFFDDVEAGETYVYSEAFLFRDVSEIASDAGYEIVYEPNAPGTYGFQIIGKLADRKLVEKASEPLRDYTNAIKAVTERFMDHITEEDEGDLRTEVQVLRESAAELTKVADDLWDQLNRIFDE